MDKKYDVVRVRFWNISLPSSADYSPEEELAELIAAGFEKAEEVKGKTHTDIYMRRMVEKPVDLIPDVD